MEWARIEVQDQRTAYLLTLSSGSVRAFSDLDRALKMAQDFTGKELVMTESMFGEVVYFAQTDG